MSFSYSILGVGQLQTALKRAEGTVEGATLKGVTRGVLRGQSIVRGRVSGRPGLRAVTGDFRRRIVGEAEAVPTGARGQIGTNRPDAARHEFGFYGPDALGRVYDYDGYPYLVPSVPEVTEAVVEELTKSIGEAF